MVEIVKNALTTFETFQTRFKTHRNTLKTPPNTLKTLLHTLKTVKNRSKTLSKRKNSIKIGIDIMRSPDLPQKYSFDPCGHDARGPARQGCPRHMRRYFEEPQCGLLFGFWGGGSGVRLRRWGAVVVVVGHKIQKLKVAAFMARLVRFGCCGARSQLSFYHIITFKLVRSG